jgi:hypothetical protein
MPCSPRPLCCSVVSSSSFRVSQCCRAVPLRSAPEREAEGHTPSRGPHKRKGTDKQDKQHTHKEEHTRHDTTPGAEHIGQGH